MGFGDMGGMDGFDMGGMDMGGDMDGIPEDRLSTPGIGDAGLGDGETYSDATCPIAMFDSRQTQSQSQVPGDESSNADEMGAGYSKNTIKALGLIRRELDLSQASTSEAADRSLSFAQSQKATRRAASSFFFELLVLGTRDCVKLQQKKPYANIEIQAKDKLYEHHSVTAQSQSAPLS